MAKNRTWLILVYKVPSEPSRLRATVWRRLKALGAVYLQNSVAAMPRTAASERAMRSLRNEIVEMGGTAQLLTASTLAGEAEIVETFNAARDEEYAEISSRCDDLLADVAKETEAAEFTYAELEEIDEDLTKMRGWLAKVANRDTLDATGRSAADAALAACEDAFEVFTNQVYDANPNH